MTERSIRRPLRLWEALALSVGLMGPTLAMSLNGIGVAGLVSNAVPLVFLLGFIGVILVGYGFWRLTQHFNHAGSVYALAGVTLGPRAGFFGGFALLGTYLFFATCTLAATGVFLQAFLGELGVSTELPWLIAALVTAALCYVVNGRESRVTARTLLIIEGVGIACMTLLAFVILGKSGGGNNGVSAFDPSLFSFAGTDAKAVGTATVFAFLSWAGFEACAALGEETDNPKRNIPRALLGSVLLTGLLFVFIMYAETVGFLQGDKGIEDFQGTSSALTELSHNFIGAWFALVVAFTAVAAGFASTLSSSAAASRLLFALARDGFGPKSFAKTDAQTGSPKQALFAVLLSAVIIDAVSSFAGVGAFDAYYWYATIGVLCLLVVYAVAAAGVVRFVLSGAASIAKWEILVPLAGMAYLTYVFYVQSFGQSAPYSYFPGIAGAWCIVGAAVVLFAPGLASRIGRNLTSELAATSSDIDEIIAD